MILGTFLDYLECRIQLADLGHGLTLLGHRKIFNCGGGANKGNLLKAGYVYLHVCHGERIPEQVVVACVEQLFGVTTGLLEVPDVEVHRIAQCLGMGLCLLPFSPT